MTTAITADDVFTGCSRAREVCDALLPILDWTEPYQQRITRSQVTVSSPPGLRLPVDRGPLPGRCAERLAV